MTVHFEFNPTLLVHRSPPPNASVRPGCYPLLPSKPWLRGIRRGSGKDVVDPAGPGRQMGRAPRLVAAFARPGRRRPRALDTRAGDSLGRGWKPEQNDL